MKILVWGIEQELQTAKIKANYLLDTAYHFDVNVELIGIGHTFTTFTDRLYILQDYLKNTNPEEIVLVMDGYDTLFNNTLNYVLNQFKSKNTKILISAEKIFTYQWGIFQDKFDNISSDYKYVNAGTYMGYAGDLKIMVDELFDINQIHPTQIDQGLLGVWVYNNFENKEKVQLDTNCEVFWVTSGDVESLKYNQLNNDRLVNPTTKTFPFIIHTPGMSDSYINESFKSAYNNIYNKICYKK
jgi:hypothetical protein